MELIKVIVIKNLKSTNTNSIANHELESENALSFDPKRHTKSSCDETRSSSMTRFSVILILRQ